MSSLSMAREKISWFADTTVIALVDQWLVNW